MTVAAIASGVWAVCSILLGWAMLAPEFQRAPSLLEMLSRPTAITLAATIIIPIALFWFIALLIWRAQELKLMSSAMTEVAIRLAEPDRMAEQQIASVGQAVRRQVNHMNEAVSRALGRAGELEALVHNEVASLEQSYTQNESRIRGLLEELAGERNALLSTSERVNFTMKELGSDIPMLVDKLSEQQVKLARFIEQAGQNLVGLEQSIAVNANQLATTVGERTHELRSVLEHRTDEIAAALSGGTQRIEGALANQAEIIDRRLIHHTENIETVFSGFAQGLDGALEQRTDQMHGVLEDMTGALEKAIGNRTELLQTVLEEYTRALDSTLLARQQGLDEQLIARTKALDDAFSERLKLFDDTIIRSTIAIDSTVADKARALSTALESHAKEIGKVLGQQAAQLDEQIMHGVHAVRRSSENVTRQSVKAIEGLAGQADLLRNISENIVGQISNVTNRFDTQGQTIMRAANALETANQRIDQNLKQRQLELGRTLDTITAKAEDIDKVMRGYPATLEGSVNEFENRARLASEQIARGAEERSRQARNEIERLKTAAESETERAVADLRSKFENVSAEVSAQIGTLQSRFTDSYDAMRLNARSTLADIEGEQLRLQQEMARLPEATRASAESVRQSLQEQLKALEHLSQLSAREAYRADVTEPTPPAGTGLPHHPRAASVVTQSITSQMAQRARPQNEGAYPSDPGTTDASREAWKLGELLARASQDEAAPAELSISRYASALDQTTASAIWSRFRAGQRGVMVRSIYLPEGRATFDDVQRRYSIDAAFRQSVDRFLGEFQRAVRDAEGRDPSGRTSQGYVISDHGRAYLFLAHAVGQIS